MNPGACVIANGGRAAAIVACGVTAAGALRLHIGAIHWNVGAQFDVAQRDAGLRERLLERERAADDEAHEIIAPDGFQVARLVNQHAVAPDAIARNVGADVEIRAEQRDRGASRLRDAEQRTRLRIGLAETQEVLRVVARQDGEIALHVAGGETGGRRIERPRSCGQTDSEASVGRNVRHCETA